MDAVFFKGLLPLVSIAGNGGASVLDTISRDPPPPSSKVCKTSFAYMRIWSKASLHALYPSQGVWTLRVRTDGGVV